MKVVFWQQSVSPHMAILADNLSARGHDVTYVSASELDAARRAQGWVAPRLRHAQLVIIADTVSLEDIIARIDDDAIHIVEGLRGNGVVGIAVARLRAKSANIVVVMETVDGRGLKGIIRPLLYRWLALRHRKTLSGILAIGDRTKTWLRKRGFLDTSIFRFAYYLSENEALSVAGEDRKFRIGYVGRLIALKRVDLLIEASRDMSDCDVVLVGDGPDRDELEGAAHGDVQFMGQLSMDAVHETISTFDVLVLPSDYDGWGAVVSESLLAGTRVIVSDACGSCVAARHDEGSAVFPAGDVDALRAAIEASKARGKVDADERAARASRSRYLGARAGAARLEAILEGAIPHDFPLTKAVP